MSRWVGQVRGVGSPRGLRVVGALAVLGILAGLGHADEPAADRPSGTIALGEAVARGAASQVRIELKAQGLFRPGPEGNKVKDGAKMPKPLSIDIQTRQIFHERVLDVAGGAAGPGRAADPRDSGRGRARKVARQVVQAASAITGEIRPRSRTLRPEVSLLIAERRDAGPVVVVCPAGPLTRSDLELVEVEGDPLALSDLLPPGPVKLGDSWRVGQAAVVGISGYDTITANTLDATLESCDEARARVRVRGRIEGSLDGAPGAMACDGALIFDRRMGWIERAEINRNESRRAGPIEAGMDVKSTLTVSRRADQPPATLSDAALARFSMEVTPRSEMLVEYGPDERTPLISFAHDRSWHIYWSDAKLMVLKRIDRGRVVAQCNLVLAPQAGRGRHQDPNQFRDEVRRILGQRFVNYIGMGEIDGDPAGGYRYKVGVQGREGDLGVVWYYYLLAGPAGDQIVATYTLAAQDAQGFGDRDVEMIQTLRWLPDRQASGRK